MKWVFSRSSMPMRTILLLIVLLMMFSLIVFVSLTANFIHKVNQKSAQSNETAADIYMNAVEEQLSRCILAMDLVAINQDIRKNIFRTDVTRSEMLVLGNAMETTISGMTYLLYKDECVYNHQLFTYLPSNGNYFFDIETAKNQVWYQTASDDYVKQWYQYSPIISSTLLYIIQPIRNFSSFDSSQLCYQVLAVDLEKLFYPMSMFFRDARASLYVYSKDGQLVYAAGSESEPQAESWHRQFQNADSSAAGYDGLGQDSMPIWRQIDGLDADLLFVFPQDGLSIEGDALEYIMFFCTASLILFLMVLLFYFYRNFTKRINLLIDKIDRQSQWQKSQGEPITGNDEISKIDRHIIAMKERNIKLMNSEFNAKIQALRAKQEALFACINPHFLYNTLNAISSAAKMEGAEDTDRMILALSDMFRYSSDISQKPVLLFQEIKNIRDYLFIQSLRFQGSFVYHIEIPEELYHCYVPKLFLQPLVENAFKHGFRANGALQEREKQLRLWATCQSGQIEISIWDNGAGIPPEQLAFLLKKLETEGTSISDREEGKIGVQNVNLRVKLLYGKKYGIKIESIAGEYTHIKLNIPYHDKEIIQDRNGFRFGPLM